MATKNSGHPCALIGLWQAWNLLITFIVFYLSFFSRKYVAQDVWISATPLPRAAGKERRVFLYCYFNPEFLMGHCTEILGI